MAEFGMESSVRSRVEAITEWIRDRVGYVAGSSSVHDSAEHTLLTGVGTCRDFAHLGVALCRAVGIPARFASVYAPGLFPMDFHAVFEVLDGGRWFAYDATDLAPRATMVRIATGRDAADAAFASVISGIATLEFLEVTATTDGDLPADERGSQCRTGLSSARWFGRRRRRPVTPTGPAGPICSESAGSPEPAPEPSARASRSVMGPEVKR